MIPNYEKKARDVQNTRYLPPGIHKATWDEFYDRFSTNLRRVMILESLLKMLQYLRDVGCKSVKIDGSLVTTKPIPKDFDGTWDPEGVNDREIDRIMLDINKIIDDNKYKGELYPAYYIEKNSKMFWDDYF